MKITPARKEFKKLVGQANHYLITARVGLWAMRENPEVYEVPQEMHAAWNPKDKKRSVDRTETFLMRSFLAWAVDALDAYFTLINRKPSLLISEDFKGRYNGRGGRSVGNRAEDLAEEYSVDEELFALVDVLITWRNNVFHSKNENKLRSGTRDVLEAHRDDIERRFCGLDVSSLADKAEQNKELTFKEAASLIHATHLFVEELDSKLIESLSAISHETGDTYLVGILKETAAEHFKNSDKAHAKYTRLEEERRYIYLMQILSQEYGFSDLAKDDICDVMEQLSQKRNK